jgi:hypothetical protein
MKRTIRPSTPVDAPAIAALYGPVESGSSLDSKYFHWKFWQPRGDWVGPRSFVLASGDDVIAHAAIVPGVCIWRSHRVSALHVIDWFARRDEPGAGVAVMKHIARQAEALLSIGGSAETRRIVPHMGFRPAGTVTAYARALFPHRLLRGGATWRLVPRLARAARGFAAPSARGAEWQARRLTGEQVSQIASVLPRPAQDMAVTERRVELFRYVLTCPIVSMELYAVERAGQVRGYFLLASVPRQVRIVDCWINSADTQDWRAMILCAVEQAKRDPQAAEVVTWASDPVLGEALRACGFYARFQTPIRLRAAAGHPVLEGPLRVQMLDNDDAFLHPGGTEYWG